MIILLKILKPSICAPNPEVSEWKSVIILRLFLILVKKIICYKSDKKNETNLLVAKYKAKLSIFFRHQEFGNDIDQRQGIWLPRRSAGQPRMFYSEGSVRPSQGNGR
jgi:hypothetical protein